MKTIERRSIVWSLLTISGCLAPASRAVHAALPIAKVDANAPQEMAIAAAIAAIPLVSNAAMMGNAATRMLFIICVLLNNYLFDFRSSRYSLGLFGLFIFLFHSLLHLTLFSAFVVLINRFNILAYIRHRKI